ncbi:hypothetical protein [Candidatus Hepatobacter penaei]|uniref:hypothetical protein n=1 Tax=Candidatus Hepatobacter penaei TaxID=1274402 RepID=UPI0010940AAA|nr:hypothetical protein [Candidatus Hepatobacter penaei]TGW15312.1 hypothetical protein EIL50_02125 [bacterium NHP-B]
MDAVMLDIQEYFSDHELLKIAFGLLAVFFLAWFVRFFVRDMGWPSSRKNTGKMTRVLDVCPLDGDRKIVLFSCPFSQGMILISPKGDHVTLFDEQKDFPPAMKK